MFNLLGDVERVSTPARCTPISDVLYAFRTIDLWTWPRRVPKAAAIHAPENNTTVGSTILSTRILIKLKGVKLMEEVFSSVANFGFPIVISVYLLVRIESKLEGLSASIQELARVIETLRVSGAH